MDISLAYLRDYKNIVKTSEMCMVKNALSIMKCFINDDLIGKDLDEYFGNIILFGVIWGIGGVSNKKKELNYLWSKTITAAGDIP